MIKIDPTEIKIGGIYVLSDGQTTTPLQESEFPNLLQGYIGELKIWIDRMTGSIWPPTSNALRIAGEAVPDPKLYNLGFDSRASSTFDPGAPGKYDKPLEEVKALKAQLDNERCDASFYKQRCENLQKEISVLTATDRSGFKCSQYIGSYVDGLLGEIRHHRQKKDSVVAELNRVNKAWKEDSDERLEAYQNLVKENAHLKDQVSVLSSHLAAATKSVLDSIPKTAPSDLTINWPVDDEGYWKVPYPNMMIGHRSDGVCVWRPFPTDLPKHRETNGGAVESGKC